MTDHKTIMKVALRYFWRHVRNYKLRFAGIFVTIPLANLALYYLPPILVATMLRRITNHQFASGDMSSFVMPLLWFAILTFLGGVVFWRLAVFFIWSLEMRILRDIQRDIFAHYMRMSANFHANHFGGSLVSQANKLASAYVRIADTTIFNIYTLLIAFIFTFVVLWPRAPWIASFLVLFSLLFIVVTILVSKKVQRLRSEEAAAETKQTGALADAITNVMAIKSFAGGAYEQSRFEKVTEHVRHTTHNVLVAATKRDTVFSTSTSILGTAATILTIVSIVIFHADIGTAFLVLTYTAGMSQRLWDFAQNTLRDYNRGLGDAQEMLEILALAPEVQDPAHPEPTRISQGAIDIRHMDFTHPDSGRGETLFVDLNLSIKPGEKIGLVGHSGSGKTTLTKLLLRFNDVDGGEILIDGQNIAHITQDDLRRSIAYVPQEPLLFHRTIEENIAYGKPDATHDEIVEAAKKANAHEFIIKLAKGYETLVGERGVKLSGGQRQRIAIARAIIKQAAILILDEATSALDSESELLIQASLKDLMKNRTTIVIAHRLSTIQRMDRIVVLEDGVIVEQGSHTELLKQNKTYAKLWKHQSGGFIEE